MKAIDNVSLSAIVADAQEEMRQKAILEAKAKVISIFGAMSQARGTVTKLRKDLEKAEAAVVKQEQLLAQLESGNWNALGEAKDEAKQD